MSITDGWDSTEVRQRALVKDEIGFSVDSRSPSVNNTPSLLEEWLYKTLCGYTNKNGWRLEETAGVIKKKNFIRRIEISDLRGDRVKVKYTGLNIESFNTVEVTCEHFKIELNIIKDSSMHNFMVDFFRHFCPNGGV